MKSLLEQFKDNNFLITTDAWFIAPDGKYYRGAWGRVEVHDSYDTLGIKTNEKSTNWYIIVGESGKRVIIAGCQIHYACVCMQKPVTDFIDEQKYVESRGEMVMVKRENIIYLAQ